MINDNCNNPASVLLLDDEGLECNTIKESDAFTRPKNGF